MQKLHKIFLTLALYLLDKLIICIRIYTQNSTILLNLHAWIFTSFKEKKKRVGLNLRMQFVNANFCLMYGNWRVISNFFRIKFYGLFSIWDKYLLVIIFCKKKKKIVKEGRRASDNPQMLKLVFYLISREIKSRVILAEFLYSFYVFFLLPSNVGSFI